MDGEIETAPNVFERPEQPIHRRRVLDVAWQDDRCFKAFGERLDALAKRLALIGERELRAMLMERLGDAPGDRMIVGNAHDEPALAAHQTCSGKNGTRLRRRHVLE